MLEALKTLIEEHKQLINKIVLLEKVITELKVNNDEDKVLFGNYIVLLKGYRLSEEAIHCILNNEDIVITEDGRYYGRIFDEEEDTTVEAEQAPGNEENKKKEE